MRLLHRISLPLIFILLCVGIFMPSTLNAKCVYLAPVKIKSMEVGNMLSWSTYEEVNNRFFIIQKSLNGVDFKKVGKVKGAGNSNKVNTYRFLDFSMGESKVYYRLLHYTSSTDFSVSATFVMERATKNNLMIVSMSSTMTDNHLNMTVESTINTSVKYEIKNQRGIVVKNGTKQVTKGLNVLSFNCREFAVGKYDVVLLGNGEKEKITIRKVATSDMPNIEYEVKKR